MSILALILFVLSLLAALYAGAASAWSDFRGLKIPNIYSIIVVVAGVLNLVSLSAVTPGGLHAGLILSHLLAGGAMFGVTFALFAFGVLGAGDSKLASAYAFFFGLASLVPFVFYMAMAGGALGIVGWFLMKFKPVKFPAAGTWVYRVQGGESKVPYGIAILIGAVFACAYSGYFGAEFYNIFSVGSE